MQHAELRRTALEANLALRAQGLVPLTWGNASVADRIAGVMAIKPSGVAYEVMEAEDIVVLSLADGKVVAGHRRPSSDTPTHLELYRGFPTIGAVVHTHAEHSTAWAQLARPLPCYGTTHADHFAGPVPVARPLTPEEIESRYEQATGVSIVETFRQAGLDPLHMPAVFLPGHAPFVWGATPQAAIENAVALEAVARMALLMGAPRAALTELPAEILRKHFERKHGPKAYYGQPAAGGTGRAML